MVRVIRNKLQKGWTYPLKATALERAIADMGIATSVVLFFHHGSFWATRPLFTASFHLVGELLRNEHEQFQVSCRSVAAADSLAARAFIKRNS